MVKPTNNHCLIEIIDEYGGIPGSRTDEKRMKGKLLDFNVARNHITASAGYEIVDVESIEEDLRNLFLNKTVLFQQYADEGQVFEEGGKRYSLIYWWRIMGVEE